MMGRATFWMDSQLLNKARAVVQAVPSLTLAGLINRGLAQALRPYLSRIPKHPRPVRLKAGRKKTRRT